MHGERQLEVDPVFNMFQGGATASLADQARVLVEVHQRKRELKEQLEAVQADYNREEERLLLMMERDGVTSMAIGDSTVYTREQTYVSVNRAFEKRAQDWLIEQGYDYLVKPTVNSRSLSTAYQELVEQGVEVPTELFNINPKKTAGITRSRRN